jgi:outer membrane immunogenic protein
MKSIFAAVIGAIALSAAPALAADLPARMPVKAMPMPVAYDWSGIYSSSAIGGGWSHVDGRSLATGANANTHGSDGWSGSSFGYQKQIGLWVVGLEAGYFTPFSSHNHHTAGGTADCAVVGAGFSCNSRINDIWNVGGRLGYSFGNWMLYGQGGYANGRIEETTSFGGIVGSGSAANHSGWYAGAGVDWYVTRFMWSDLILGVEYRHYELDSRNHADFPTAAFNRSFSGDVDMVLAKATFKWVGMGPLSAFR